MRTTRTFTISLPPKMMQELEQAQKAEQRTRSELVREALRFYLGNRERRAFEQWVDRIPWVKPTTEEMRVIERGRNEIKRGDYVTLDQLNRELDRPPLKVGRKNHRTRARA